MDRKFEFMGKKGNEKKLWKNIDMVKEEIINKDRPLGIVISGSVASGDFICIVL